MTVRIGVDRERCIGAGMCALTAPELFDQDAGDGRVLVLISEPEQGHQDDAREAAEVCPSGAISVHERAAG